MGTSLGAKVGRGEGREVGSAVGLIDGWAVGELVGSADGRGVGTAVGLKEMQTLPSHSLFLQSAVVRQVPPSGHP